MIASRFTWSCAGTSWDGQMRRVGLILAILALLIVALIIAALVLLGDFMCGYDNSC